MEYSGGTAAGLVDLHVLIGKHFCPLSIVLEGSFPVKIKISKKVVDCKATFIQSSATCAEATASNEKLM